MAGGDKKIHLHPNAGSNGFDKDPSRAKGRPPSFKKEFARLLDSEGFITYKKEQVVKINEDGSVKIKVPKKDAIAMKAVSWAMSNRGAESTKMIQWIVEMFEGKATQRNEDKVETTMTIIDMIRKKQRPEEPE